MDAGFLTTLAAIFGTGVVVIVGLWWTARLRDKAEFKKMTSPPERHIPGFAPTTPAPEYLSELESRAEPAGAVSTDLDDKARDDLRSRLDTADVMLDAGYVLGEFATDRPTSWAVLERPVVVIVDELTSMRELIGILGAAPDEALVIVSTKFAGDVVDTLRANKTRRLMRVCAVLADAEQVHALAERFGVDVIPRADLQSGWVPPLGRATQWVSTPTNSYAFLDTSHEPSPIG